MNTWFSYHFMALRHAFAQFRRSPGHFFFNVLVLSMTLALPFGGLTLLVNVESVTRSLSVSPEVSVFLKMDTDRNQAQSLEPALHKVLSAAKLQADVVFIPKEAALNSLEERSDLTAVVDSLGQNPLPDSYIIRFADSPSRSEQAARIESIARQWQQLPHVDKVQIDSDWTKRLAALLGVMRMGLVFLAIVLGVVIVVVTFNTIRLQVLMHLDEITISWRVGASRAYIRRPFYYMGLFLGFFSGCCALLLVDLCLYPFNTALSELTQLYGSDFQLTPLGPVISALLLAASAGLGWLGALLSVNRQLGKMS